MNQYVRILLPIVVFGLGIGGAVVMIKNRPKAKRASKTQLPTLVEVKEVQRQDAPTRVLAMGEITAAQEVRLQPQVAGAVVSVSGALVPGGRVQKGAMLARIDAKNYEFVLKQQEAALERARYELAVEQGRQRIAQREWKLINKKNASEEGKALALRKPHLENAQASVMSAQSGVERARLDVSRTVLRAPFNAVVISENIDVGQVVNAQTEVARLVGTDRFWVQVSVPVSDLRWIALPTYEGETPQSGASVQVMQDAGGALIERTGRVVKLLGDLDPRGRMARLLVEVDDPLGLQQQEDSLPMLLGAYVRVDIEGKAVDDVFVVPRLALREGGKVWVMGAGDRLEIRPVKLVYRGPEHVYVKMGLKTGERVVTSRIPSPVPGMALRKVTDGAEAATASAVAP